MRFRQYIPVKTISGGGGDPGGGESPDPAIYCPIHGYIPDPTIYVEDPVITETPRPAERQIRLIVTDSGSRHFSFRCTVSNAGRYVVTVTGYNNIVIGQQTINNNTTCTVYVPLLEGFLAESYTYFYIDIAPELETNDLTSFISYVNTTYDSLGPYIIAAFFNAPELTTLHQAFNHNKRLIHVEFLTAMNSLTALSTFCNNCEALRKVVFHSGFPELTTLQSAFAGTNLAEISLPNDMPKLLSMQSTFTNAKLKEFTFPSNIPSLLSLASTFLLSEIESISFPMATLPEVNTLNQFCSECKKLKGKITYPEMPKVTTIERVHYLNDNIEEIEFQGNMAPLETIYQAAIKCYKLKKITFPEIVTGITAFASRVTNVVDECSNLEEVILPKTFHIPAYTSNTYKFFNSFQGCFKLHAISTIESAVFGNQYGTVLGNSLISLKRWDQPNSFYNSSSMFFEAPVGINGSLEYYEVDWNQAPKAAMSFRRQNMSVSEIRRILSAIVNYPGRPFVDYFYLAGNPEWQAAQGYWNPSGVTNNGRTISFNATRWDSRINIGHSLHLIQGNGSSVAVTIIDNNSFELAYTGFRVAPYNGVKFIYYLDDLASFGILPFKTFYVVNSDGDSGKMFQLSETESGQPYQFNFGVNEIGQSFHPAHFSCSVTDINFDGANHLCTIDFPMYYNSGSRYGAFIDSNVFDFWEFAVKAFRPEYFS